MFAASFLSFHVGLSLVLLLAGKGETWGKKSFPGEALGSAVWHQETVWSILANEAPCISSALFSAACPRTERGLPAIP